MSLGRCCRIIRAIQEGSRYPRSFPDARRQLPLPVQFNTDRDHHVLTIFAELGDACFTSFAVGGCIFTIMKGLLVFAESGRGRGSRHQAAPKVLLMLMLGEACHVNVLSIDH